MSNLRVIEVCAGAGGQALGLTKAGFDHELAVELDENAARTLQLNTGAHVVVGDVADTGVWRPADYQNMDLFAGGVPCPPFSLAGRQLGTSDERDLFAWAVELVGSITPRAVMLENVRGLAMPRFAAYRQRVLDRLAAFGYLGEWRLLHSADFGVAQLRPRFVLVAMRPEEMSHFYWPDPLPNRTSVGEALGSLMGAEGWRYAEDWARAADTVGPTLVGGSKKHGGADLGPTRAKQAWIKLGVDGRGIANAAPGYDAPPAGDLAPRLTIEMVARLQGWSEADSWTFTGGKTSQYRQIGNAFPPPVAQAVGVAIHNALSHVGTPRNADLTAVVHDPIYRKLAQSAGYVSAADLVIALTENTRSDLERRVAMLSRDFEVAIRETTTGVEYRLGAFKGFVGQEDHVRHEFMSKFKSAIS